MALVRYVIYLFSVKRLRLMSRQIKLTKDGNVLLREMVRATNYIADHGAYISI